MSPDPGAGEATESALKALSALLCGQPASDPGQVTSLFHKVKFMLVINKITLRDKRRQSLWLPEASALTFKGRGWAAAWLRWPGRLAWTPGLGTRLWWRPGSEPHPCVSAPRGQQLPGPWSVLKCSFWVQAQGTRDPVTQQLTSRQEHLLPAWPSPLASAPMSHWPKQVAWSGQGWAAALPREAPAGVCMTVPHTMQSVPSGLLHSWGQGPWS